MQRNVREIFSHATPVELIQPLLSWYPNHRKIGTSQSYFFSAWLNNPLIAPDVIYDFIDYCEDDLTGEEMYTTFKSVIDGGFLGGQRFTEAQGNLLQAYVNSIIQEVAG